MLVQPAIQGVELQALLFDVNRPLTARLPWLRRMGAQLASLHRLVGLDLPRHTVADDLAELFDYTGVIAQGMPALAPIYTATLDRLADVAPQLTAMTPAVCHGALRTDQFMLSRQACLIGAAKELISEALTLIDLDTVCLANPAYLQWKAIRQPQHAQFIQQAVYAFMAAYATTNQPPAADWLAFYRAVALLKIAGRRFRNLTYREWALTPHLVQAARECVAQHPVNMCSSTDG